MCCCWKHCRCVLPLFLMFFLWGISVTVRAMQSKPVMAALPWKLGVPRAEILQSSPQDLKSHSVKLLLLQACLHALGMYLQTRCALQFLAEIESWGLSARQSLRLCLRFSVQKKVQIWECSLTFQGRGRKGFIWRQVCCFLKEAIILS